jgi:hypothetical protein
MASDFDSNTDLDSDSEIDFHSDSSDSASASDSYNLEPSPIISEPSLEPSILCPASIPRPKHSIGARLFAIVSLEVYSVPHAQITATTGISKAQIYKL